MFARCFAEGEGFEPSVPVKGRLVSSEVLSTTQPTLRVFDSTRQNNAVRVLYHKIYSFSTLVFCLN